MLIDTFSRDELKILGINVLSRLGICLPYLLDYAANDSVYLFDYADDWNGRRIDLNSELGKKIAELHRDYHVHVYAVTHEEFSFGDVYTFLCLSPYIEDFDFMLSLCIDKIHRAYAYGWNRTSEECSEFGSVFLSVSDGTIRRVG